MTNGVLSSHFEHCDRYVLFDMDVYGRSIGRRQQLTSPREEPSTLPRWLHAQGATVIIAGEMGSRAQSRFAHNDIQVAVGASCAEPDVIVRSFLDGHLGTGANVSPH